MSISGFNPTIWSAQLQTSYKNKTIFGGPSVTNSDYEGDIANGGDTVRITSISRPTVATYTKDTTTITPETLTDAQRTLTIDQSKYFAFEVDDIDKRQSANGGALLTEAADEAAYALVDTTDSYVAALYTGVATANAIGTVSVTSAALAFTQIINLRKLLDTANAPSAGRYVVMPPWYEALLLADDRIIRVDASGSAGALREGMVGRMLGFDLFVSNNCINVTGDDWIVQAGHPSALTFANQINSVEAYRPENAFSDALKGLHLYGAKLTRPTGIATVAASIT